MSNKSKFFATFLAYVVLFDVCYGQTILKQVNRASNQNFCLQVSPSGTAADGMCVSGTTRVADFSVGLTLPTSGGTKSTLNYYEEFNTAITALGPNTGGGSFNTISGNIKITRIGRLVTINVEGIQFTTASGVSGISITPNIPSRFFPAFLVLGPELTVGDGGTGVFWRMQLSTAGNILISTRDNTGANTTIANATYGPQSFVITYSI